jgi:hypothetical protein
MWFVILWSLITLGLGVCVFLAVYDAEEVLYSLFMSTTAVVLSGLWGFVFSYPVIGTTGGLGRDYSVGVRDGYLTKVSQKGVIWKTNEAQLQVGTGNMAALQEPFEFSVPDAAIATEAGLSIGKKVRVHYTQWIIQPFARGESGYECVRIELLDEGS